MKKEQGEVYLTNGNKKPNSFGGYVYESDFESGKYSSMSHIAARIRSDMRFDQNCGRKINLKESYEEFTYA